MVLPTSTWKTTILRHWREEAKKAFGDNGIANFSDVANRMASYGRGGDDTLAHVATGEIVIPLPLIDNNP